MSLQNKLMSVGQPAAMAQQTAGDVAATAVATGTTQADALPLSCAYNYVTTVNSGTGVRLYGQSARPSSIGDEQTVYNAGANALNVYPPAGEQILGVIANAAFSIPTSSKLTFKKVTNTLWVASETFVQSGTAPTYGWATRTVQGKAVDFISVKDVNNSSGSAVTGDGTKDDSSGIQAALNLAASLGTGVTVFFPRGAYNLGTTTITVPTKVTLRGDSRETTFLNYSGTGTALDIDSVNQWTIRDLRIGLGSSASIVAVNIRTASANVRWGKISNVEIAPSSIVAGQKGIQVVASGGKIVTDNWFEDINFFGVDKPIIRTDTEGNTWRGIHIDTWGATASCNAIDSQSHAEFMQARVAGIPAGGTGVAYKQTSDDNIDNIVVDIGAGQTALNVTGIRNTITVSRTGATTPIGSYSTSNIIHDAAVWTLRGIGAFNTATVGSAIADQLITLGGSTASCLGNDHTSRFGTAAVAVNGLSGQSANFVIRPQGGSATLRMYNAFDGANNGFMTFGLTNNASAFTLSRGSNGTGTAITNFGINVPRVMINTGTDDTVNALQVAGAITATASHAAHSGTAIPAGGTAGAGYLVSSTSNFGIFFGSGAPSLSAAKGSLYLRSDGSGTGDRAYINTNGSTTWTALTTAA